MDPTTWLDTPLITTTAQAVAFYAAVRIEIRWLHERLLAIDDSINAINARINKLHGAG